MPPLFSSFHFLKLKVGEKSIFILLVSYLKFYELFILYYQKQPKIHASYVDLLNVYALLSCDGRV